jgi:hypothetical protein
LLELKGLEEVNKYSFFTPSSLLVVKLIINFSRKEGFSDLSFIFLLLAIFSGFNCLLSALISSKRKRKAHILRPGSRFGFKARLFLLFELGNCSAISLVVVVLVIIVTPHVVCPRILRRLASTSGKRFSYCLLVVKVDLYRCCA